MSSAMLEVKDLSVNYGAIQALEKVSFEVNKGEILSLIGCNGAGKTTCLRSISGLVKIANGSIHYKNEKISGMPAHKIVQRRLYQSPEGRGIFLNLSVSENLDLGAWCLKDKAKYAENMEKAFELFPRLKERQNQNAGTLSGGEQQMLAIARALMGSPDLLLLDEPSLGLAPQIIEKIFEIIKDINKQGVTILLVEQNALQALQISHRGLVLETGRLAMQGDSKDLLKSDEVRRAYLGEH